MIRLLLALFLIANLFSCKAIPIAKSRNEKTIDLGRLTIATLHEALLKKDLSCVDIVKMSLDRIKAFNLSPERNAPLNAIVSINSLSLERAQELDRYQDEHGKLRGPLHCVTVAVKDNIDTYDMPTSAGSLALLRSQPNEDAEVIKKLRQAGAIIFLKTTMDELASGMFGESSLSGRTGNVFDPKLNSGGSSGGTGVAVAAGFSLVGLGSDNSGSVRIPAAFNGIYGLRPTGGLINKKGIFPRGSLDGEIGPMARELIDLEKLFAVLVDKNYEESPIAGDLHGLRLGIVENIGKKSVYDKTSPKALAIYSRFIENLKANGAEVKSISFKDFDIDREDNMSGEIEDVDEYLSSYPAAVASFRDLCLSGRLLAFKDQKSCLLHIKKTAKKGSAIYKRVLQRFSENQARVLLEMKNHGVDLLLSPISYEGLPTYDPYQVMTWQWPLSSNASLPGLAIIIDSSDDSTPLPISVELLAAPSNEQNLFYWAKKIKDVKRPILDLEKLRDKKSHLKDFDIPMLNNLFVTIGYRAYRYRLTHRLTQKHIDPLWFSPLVEESITLFKDQMSESLSKKSLPPSFWPIFPPF